jgi:hypothetical protein
VSLPVAIVDGDSLEIQTSARRANAKLQLSLVVPSDGRRKQSRRSKSVEDTTMGEEMMANSSKRRASTAAWRRQLTECGFDSRGRWRLARVGIVRGATTKYTNRNSGT